MVNECLQISNINQYNNNSFSNTFYNNSNSKVRTCNDTCNDASNSNTFKNQKSQLSQSMAVYYNNEYKNAVEFANQRRQLSDTVLDVYEYNLSEGIKKLRQLCKCSSVVAIDTEFPGIIVQLNQFYMHSLEFYYQNVKMNNDLMKPIQIGFSFFDEHGKSPMAQSTIQFNFKWDMSRDLGNKKSITLLQESGINFWRLQQHGIEPESFAELFMSTGLPINDTLTWVGFHCAHDWPYILKILTGWPEMPDKFSDFNTIMKIYFPKTVDLKTLLEMKDIRRIGLQYLSGALHVKRHGSQHQAGSDSLLAGETYFQFIKLYYEDNVKEEYYNLIFGLNYCSEIENATSNSSPVTTDDVNETNSSARSSPLSVNDKEDDEFNSNIDSNLSSSSS